MSFEYSSTDDAPEPLEFQCPNCGNEHAQVVQRLLQIPYYNDYHMIVIFCPKCGLRKTDFANIESKGHTEYQYRVEDEEDQTTKVVRAENGIVEVPELGVKIEPVTNPQTWIRNIEGILLDIKEKVEFARDNTDDPSVKEAAKERLKQIDAVLMGKIPITIIVNDITGNSIIIPAKEEKLKVKVLSQ